MPVWGERSLMVRTARSMSDIVCTLEVGLLGLHRNTRPAPIEPRISASRSRRKRASTGVNFTGALMLCAVPFGDEYDGSAVTRARSGEQ